MNFTFKLSRRLARFKAAGVIAACLFTLSSCSADGPNAPVSSTDPTGVSISPDTVTLGVNQTTQFEASPDSSALGAYKGEKAPGRNAVVDLAITPHSYTMAKGSTASFAAVGTLRNGRTSEPAVTWSAAGGTIDSSGKYTAGPTVGNYSVKAWAANGVADTAVVIITETTPPVATISLSPSSSSMPAGGAKQFTTVGTASDGTTVPVSPKYAATGGTISPEGMYRAGPTPGAYSVIATDSVSGKADTAAVTITASGATLQAVELTPSTASLAAGATQQFTASGKMSDGSTTPITASFAATGGTISSTGLYTAGATAGSYRVIATQGGGTAADTAAVTITAPTAPPTSGTTYFLANAESGTVSPPLQYPHADGGGLLPINATTRAKNGTRSFKFEIAPSTSSTSKSQFLQNAPQSSMRCQSNHFCTGWYSWYTYVDAGYTSPTDWNMLLGWMTAVSGAPSPISHIGLEMWGGNGTTRGTGPLQVVYTLKNCSVGLYACPTIPGYANSGGWYKMTSASPAGIVSFPRGQWVHLAVYYKMAPTNGQVTIWQDGVKIMDLTAPTMNTFGGHSIDPLHNTAGDLMLQFGAYGGAESQTRRIYVDDFRVSNYRPAP